MRPDLTRALGDQWLREASSAILWVRSIIAPETFNVLVNPRHPDAARIRLLQAFAYPVDPRLLR